MKTKPNKPAEAAEPEKKFEGFGDDEPVSITVSRKELETLFDGARALELMRAIEHETGEEIPLIIFAVLLKLTAMPTWNAVVELQDRYRDAELKAAGQLDKLEAAVNKITAH